jgi:flavin-dependent dehydrogenase
MAESRERGSTAGGESADQRGSDPRRAVASQSGAFRVEKVAVVGAGPGGSTAALLLARAGKRVTCYDPRNILRATRPSCTGCAGLIQDSCIRDLESIGLVPPEAVVQRRLRGYVVHLGHGAKMTILTKRMISVYRGFGPLESSQREIEGFDAWLLSEAIAAGARFEAAAVSRIETGVEGEARLTTSVGPDSADFVIGAFGHSRRLADSVSVAEGERLDQPTVQRSSVFEFSFGEDFCEKTYGDFVHVVIVPKQLYPQLNVWFAAFVPKRPGSVSVVVMGRRDVTIRDAEQFFAAPPVRALLPAAIADGDPRLITTLTSMGGRLQCVCTKNTVTVAPPARFLLPVRGGIALVGDAGPTRPFKNGIGAAIDLGARLAEGVIAGDLESFRRYADRHYPPDDYKVALQLLHLHDRVLSLRPIEALLAALVRYSIPFVSGSAKEYAQHMLAADIAYGEILPPGVRTVFRSVARRRTIGEGIEFAKRKPETG